MLPWMHEKIRAELKSRALEAPGDTDGGLRAAVQNAVADLARGSDAGINALDETIRPFVEAVARHAYAIEDHDVERLRAGPYSEAATFEITVNAAVAAGLERLSIAMETWEKV